MPDCDAVVIGAGHNGLVAANLLADAGWDVVVLEAADRPGGAVRSGEIAAPGFRADLYSAFYPLGAASPVLRELDLHAHGLRWSHAPAVLGHVLEDGRCVVLSRDVEETAASVDSFGRGDAAAWRREVDRWQALREPLLEMLLRPFPPVRPGLRLARRTGLADGLRLARLAVLSVHRYADEEYAGEGAALLLAGNALHTDLAPESPAGALFGWLLAMLGQDVGFPVPVGGAERIVDALVARLALRGARVECGREVTQVLVRGGRAFGVRTAGGETVTARHAVLADVTAPRLYRRLVGDEHLPARLRSDLDRFQWDNPTVKVDWALSGPIPWRAADAARCGTVHVGGDLAALGRYSAQLATGEVPEAPFAIVGQMTTSDPTRSPAGTEVAWAYTHLPRERRDPAAVDEVVRRTEDTLERLAPGFRDLVVGRRVAGPRELEADNANLAAGAVNGGTAAIWQQLVFRPVPGLARAETPVRDLYLAGSSAHPGGGVHGACGANAARAALLRRGLTGRAAGAAIDGVVRRVYR